MIATPAILTFFEDAFDRALGRLSGSDRPISRKARTRQDCLALYTAGESELREMGLTRQHVLRLMSQHMGR